MRGLRMLVGSWVLLVGVAGCGGRAMYDSDDMSGDPRGSMGGGASGSGPGSTGTMGGTAGGSSPSAGGTPGVTNVVDGCASFCSSQASKVCVFEADAAKCTESCRNELGRQSARCRVNATQMLACLVASYRSSLDCNTAEDIARSRCATSITFYQICVSDQFTPPSPAEPSPASNLPIPEGCSGTGRVDEFSCTMSMKCGDRTYDEIRCKQGSDGSSLCACGSFAIGLSESVNTACQTVIWNCLR